MNNIPDKYKSRLYYKFKNNHLVQSALINTILTRYNCPIDYLAVILHVDENNLKRAWNEQELLSDKEATNLVCLFYTLLGCPDNEYRYEFESQNQ